MFVIISFNNICALKTCTYGRYVKTLIRNKSPMRLIGHTWNQFKSINTFAQNYDYIIIDVEMRIMSFKLIIDSFLFVKILSHVHQAVRCDMCRRKLTQWFCRRTFSNFNNVFSLFRNTSPFNGAWPYIWTNVNSLHPRMLCSKFGWNWPRGSWEENENVKSLQTDKQTKGQTIR